MTDGDGDINSIQRDIDGNPISITSQDGKGVKSLLGYIRNLSKNQLTKRILLPSDPAEEIATFGYDVLGNVTSATDPDSSITMLYDLLGRLTSVATTGSLSQPDVTIAYTYDKNNNRKIMDDSVAIGQTDYIYDTLNRLTSLTNPAGQAFSFDYDVLRRVKQLTRPNGITTDYSYDPLSQLLSLKKGSSLSLTT